MKKTRCAVMIGLFAVFGIVSLSGEAVQGPPDQEEVWRTFVAWFKTATPEGNPTRGYIAELQKKGVTRPEIDRQVGIITRLFFNRPEGVEIYYDKIFARPITGEPARDGFATSPSELLVNAVQGAKPGTALDVGMGQGRNAVYLAQKGWDVTGFDISGNALAAARANAEKAGVNIRAVKASYDTFEFGAGKWDLIVLTFAWAPITDRRFQTKLGDSLRPGGRIVFEHFISAPPQPEGLNALQPGQLRKALSGFVVESYEEITGTGDWGGPGSPLVRMIARKP